MKVRVAVMIVQEDGEDGWTGWIEGADYDITDTETFLSLSLNAMALRTNEVLTALNNGEEIIDFG